MCTYYGICGPMNIFRLYSNFVCVDRNFVTLVALSYHFEFISNEFCFTCARENFILHPYVHNRI